MSEQKRIISKLKKLLALGKSMNQHEAANALAKAQVLMKAHNLTEQDVSLSAISSSETQGAPSDAGKIPTYMQYLGQTITRATGCEFYWRRRDGKRTLVFYGPGERPVIASYLFDVLARKITAARREFIASMNKRIKRTTKTARADAFCEAWASAVYHAISAFVVSDSERTLMTTWFDHHQNNQGGKFKSANYRDAKKANGTDDAAYIGHRAGRQVKIHQGVSGSGDTGPVLLGRGDA